MTTNLPLPVVSSLDGAVMAMEVVFVVIFDQIKLSLSDCFTRKRHLSLKKWPEKWADEFRTYDFDRKNFINLFWKIENDIFFSTQSKIRLVRAIELDENYLKEHYLTILSLPFKLRFRKIHVITEFIEVCFEKWPNFDSAQVAPNYWINQKKTNR